jgi:hypothetical protein
VGKSFLLREISAGLFQGRRHREIFDDHYHPGKAYKIFKIERYKGFLRGRPPIIYIGPADTDNRTIERTKLKDYGTLGARAVTAAHLKPAGH